MFGESKIVETETPPVPKAECPPTRKNKAGASSETPTVETEESKHAANFVRLKKASRKASRGIF